MVHFFESDALVVDLQEGVFALPKFELSLVRNETVSFFETFGIIESKGELRIRLFGETWFRALDSWYSNESSVASSCGLRTGRKWEIRQHNQNQENMRPYGACRVYLALVLRCVIRWCNSLVQCRVVRCNFVEGSCDESSVFEAHCRSFL